MTYDFSLEKKAALIITLGLAVVGLLLFVAGWIAGSQYAMSALDPAARPAGQAATLKPASGQPAAPKGQAAPAVPVAPPAAGGVEDPSLLPPGVAPIAVEPVAADDSPAAANPVGAKPAAGAPVAAAATNDAPNPSAGGGDAVVVKEAAPAPAAATSTSEAPAPVGSSVFSVQVGAFLEPTDAERLAKELQNRGYTPNIFSGNDGELRQWYAVRIGAYADPKEAAEAATNFSKQEKMKAAVRPIDSL